MKQNDIVRVSVDKLGYGGEGIARIDNFVLFVPRALPGDVLDVRIKTLKKRYGSADIAKIHQPSVSRRESGCAAFQAGCGGCQWLHLEYAEQCRQKVNIIEESFKRIGKTDVRVDDVVAAEQRYGCRNTFSLSRDSSGTLGLCAEKSADVLELADCRMESDPNIKAYNRLKQTPLPNGVTHANFRSGTDGAVSLCLYAASVNEKLLCHLIQPLIEDGTIAGAALKLPTRFAHLAGERSISATVGEFRYSIPIDVFFQTNYEQAEKLLALVLREIEPGPGDSLLDLYGGIGFFAFRCSLAGSRVTCVESHPEAVRGANQTARSGNIDISIIRSDVGGYLRGCGDGENRFSKIILDPPRSGCGKDVVRQIAALDPDKIVYVSCAPDTLARDCAFFSEFGYRIAGCSAIDMFPQTYHAEVVATLVRR